MKKKEFNKNNDAVSPVIGVMLMIVVTVILAAAVSGYAGGLTGNMKKAPQLTMEVSITNDGYSKGSGVFFDILSVSEPIPTKDIKIITSWSNDTGINGATVTAFDGTNYNTRISTSSYYHAPLGFGEGVNSPTQSYMGSTRPLAQQFGSYTLIPGTTMKSSPTQAYSGGSYGTFTGTDAMQAIFGKFWYELSPGDIVNVQIVHIPSSKVIFEKNVGVQ